MPYKNYLANEEFHEDCPFWGAIEREISRRYKPNPWIFKAAYRLFPDTQEYAFTYRNFDDSQHLHFDVVYKEGQLQFRFPPAPHPDPKTGA